MGSTGPETWCCIHNRKRLNGFDCFQSVFTPTPDSEATRWVGQADTILTQRGQSVIIAVLCSTKACETNRTFWSVFEVTNGDTNELWFSIWMLFILFTKWFSLIKQTVPDNVRKSASKSVNRVSDILRLWSASQITKDVLEVWQPKLDILIYHLFVLQIPHTHTPSLTCDAWSILITRTSGRTEERQRWRKKAALCSLQSAGCGKKANRKPVLRLKALISRLRVKSPYCLYPKHNLAEGGGDAAWEAEPGAKRVAQFCGSQCQ